jgi:hypothetical protein
MALVLLQVEAAEAFALACASPKPQSMLQGPTTRQAKRLGGKPSTQPPSPQAAYAQDHGAGLETCKVLVGRAKLGGQPGILITSIDTKQNKTWLFCRGTTGADCVLRTAKPRETATGWAKGSLTKKRIARGQFAYMIKRAEASGFLIILFGPDITPYLQMDSCAGKQSCASSKESHAADPIFSSVTQSTAGSCSRFAILYRP